MLSPAISFLPCELLSLNIQCSLSLITSMRRLASGDSLANGDFLTIMVGRGELGGLSGRKIDLLGSDRIE